MAPSPSLNKLNPQKLWLSMTLAGLAILVIATTAGIFIALKQNQSLVKTENKMILRRNGELLTHQNIRTFIESLGFEEKDYRVSIDSDLDHQKVIFGKLKSSDLIQCSTEFYYQYQVQLCRPIPISWVSIASIFALFLGLIIVVALIVRRLGVEMVDSFQNLFLVARIKAPQKMNFNQAWSTAFSMAQNFKDFQEQMLIAERDRTIVDLSRQVAHDIRSPLTALNILTAHLEELSEDKRSLAKQAVQRIDQIANDLLLKSKPNLNQTDLTTLTKQILAEKQIEFHQQKIEFQAPPENLRVSINSNDFSRILSNLINNSLEAHAQKIRIQIKENENSIELKISDDGQGIEPDKLRKVGEANYTSKKNGNGLGVAHAKNTLESIGGSLSISSQINQGTQVTLKIPKY